jgi:hypothetical protein
MNSSANARCSATACSISSRSVARFGKPVSASRRACLTS